MSYLKFITIDVLCVAAEVTAALLLLAFAIPEKKKAASTAKVSDAELEQLLVQARQFCIESAVFRGLAILRSPELASFHHSSELSDSLQSLGYEDKLTHSANHAFAEAFLTKWLRLPTDHRLGSSLAMVVVDDYSDLLRSKGAMEIEAILRQLSEMIHREFGANSIISRYQPDRFLILNFSGDMGSAYNNLVNLRTNVTALASDESKGQCVFDCTNSIVDLGEESIDLEQTIEDLDEGISQASESAEKCVARAVNCGWQATLPGSSTDSNASSKRDSQTTAPQAAMDATGRVSDTGNTENVSDTKMVSGDTQKVSGTELIESTDAPHTTSLQVDSTDEVAPNIAPGSELNPPSDVQAVAKNEDIEALFEQINKNRNKIVNSATAAEQSKTKQATAATNAFEDTISPYPEIDSAESATAADIADLFATVKGATQPASREPEKTPNASPAAPEVELDGAVSADDIADLFASAKNAGPETPTKSERIPATAPTAQSTAEDKLPTTNSPIISPEGKKTSSP